MESKRKIYVNRILVYYCFPELFLAQDKAGLDYLCLLTELNADECNYHCVSISKKRLNQYLNGKVDLRDIFTNPELSEWWVTSDTSQEEIEIVFFSNEGLSEELLPEKDCFLYQTDQK